ncbi:O-methyltransferase [Streptomyces sp. 4N509B]|uniref:O-methyltransferase n=1 Tax=Streptomyces sp. 4N509B TaxID=3457413 RepID=UPI003FD2FAD2
MSVNGTAAHASLAERDLPPLVARAVALARAQGFAFSCQPEQGRLLHALAGGATRAVGETGTGCGVGLAWLATAAGPGVRLVSVERDPVRARLAAELFAADERVTVLCGDWRELRRHGPFDLLVLDGGGQGKAPGDEPADPGAYLAPGGTVVVDDFTPARPGVWPPRHEGEPDRARLHWLNHPSLRSVELRLAPGLAAVVGVMDAAARGAQGPEAVAPRR